MRRSLRNQPALLYASSLQAHIYSYFEQLGDRAVPVWTQVLNSLGGTGTPQGVLYSDEIKGPIYNSSCKYVF